MAGCALKRVHFDSLNAKSSAWPSHEATTRMAFSYERVGAREQLADSSTVQRNLLQAFARTSTGTDFAARPEFWEWVCERRAPDNPRGEFHVLADNPGMKHELSGLLAKAWKRGLRNAVRELVKHGGAVEAAVQKRLRRNWELRLPQECPYTIVEIAGYESREEQAVSGPDVWPAAVALVLNEQLGTNYPVRPRSPERRSGHGL